MTTAPPVSTDDEALTYEETHVHSVYESIASHFSSTRYKPWPVVDTFLRDLTPGSIGLDVGCGNGKYLAVNKDIFIVGSDRSSNLVALATHQQTAQPTNSVRDRFHDACIVADSLSLPHADHAFDFAICIAVIHHLSSPARRVAAIRAVVRTLKRGTGKGKGTEGGVSGVGVSDFHPAEVHDERGETQRPPRGRDVQGQGQGQVDGTAGASGSNIPAAAPSASPPAPSPSDGPAGPSPRTRAAPRNRPGQALLFVWALEQHASRRGWKAGDEQDVLVPWVLKDKTKDPKPAQTQTQTQHTSSIGGGDKGEGDRVFNRYYHLYAAGELERECARAGARVVRSGYDRDNWWVVVEPGPTGDDGGDGDEVVDG